MSDEGASNNERLLAAARDDNEELLEEVFNAEGTYDINYRDGLGNTALHYAAAHGSAVSLDLLLVHEGTDVDLQNRLEKATPLHLAMRLEAVELRQDIVDSLLEAGADPRIKDKNGDKPIDLIGSGTSEADIDLRKSLRRAEATLSVDTGDIAADDDDDESDGEPSDEDE